MAYRRIPMPPRKRVALIAHDNCKTGLLDWARYNRDTLDITFKDKNISAGTSRWAPPSPRDGSTS